MECVSRRLPFSSSTRVRGPPSAPAASTARTPHRRATVAAAILLPVAELPQRRAASSQSAPEPAGLQPISASGERPPANQRQTDPRRWDAAQAPSRPLSRQRYRDSARPPSPRNREGLAAVPSLLRGGGPGRPRPPWVRSGGRWSWRCPSWAPGAAGGRAGPGARCCPQSPRELQEEGKGGDGAVRDPKMPLRPARNPREVKGLRQN